MLVLNTNQGGGGENVLSNANVMTNYPDIDNSILLFPDRWNWSSQTLATINNIDFQMLWWVISKNDLFNLRIREDWKLPPLVWTQIPNGSVVRLWMIWTLDELIWSVVWKKIIYPDLIRSSSASVSYRSWILHSDWTITYFDESEYSNDAWSEYFQAIWWWWDWNTSSVACFFANPRIRIRITNWIVVQKWDRLIGEFRSTSANNIAFWSFTPTKPSNMLKPIQFSID